MNETPGDPTSPDRDIDGANLWALWIEGGGALETGFEVWYATNGGTLALVHTTAADVYIYLLSSSFNFATTQAAFKMRAKNDAVGAPFSPAYSGFTSTVYTAPVAPTTPSIVMSSGKIVDLGWTHPEQTGGGWVDHYLIEGKNLTAIGAWELMNTVSAASTSYNHSFTNDPLAAGSADSDEIAFRVIAVRGADQTISAGEPTDFIIA